MNREQPDALQKRITELDDDALIEMVAARESDYREDALQIAREELKRRAIPEPTAGHFPSPETAPTTRSNRGRRWWLAAVLALAASGLGQLYNGQLWKAVLYFTTPLALVVLSFLGLSFGGGAALCLALFVAAFVVRLASVVDAVISASSQSTSYELKFYNRLIVYVAVVAVAYVAALAIRVSVVEAMWVPSGAMLPTIQIGDHLVVNKLRYGVHSPLGGRQTVQRRPLERDDIVLFTSPVDRKVDLIQRVIAIAGDTVEVRNKKLLINGEPVPDPHAAFTDPNGRATVPRDNFGPVTVPVGKFFVMGDNRDQSYDSRHWGFADTADVKGQAAFVYWSWNSQTHQMRWDRIGRSLR